MLVPGNCIYNSTANTNILKSGECVKNSLLAK